MSCWCSHRVLAMKMRPRVKRRAPRERPTNLEERRSRIGLTFYIARPTSRSAQGKKFQEKTGRTIILSPRAGRVGVSVVSVFCYADYRLGFCQGRLRPEGSLGQAHKRT